MYDVLRDVLLITYYRHFIRLINVNVTMIISSILLDKVLLKYSMSFPRISKGFAKRAGRIPRDQIGGRQKGTARLFYKRPLRSQKLVVYPPAILSRSPRSHWIPLFFPLLLFLSFLFFFFFKSILGQSERAPEGCGPTRGRPRWFTIYAL